MQEFDKFVGAGANFFDLGRLFDRIKIVAHVVHTAAGGSDDIVEAGKIPHEQRFRGGAIGVEPAVRHRLSAAGLVTRIDDLVIEPLQELQCRDADLWEKGVDVARDEKPDAHCRTVRASGPDKVSCAPPSSAFVLNVKSVGASLAAARELVVQQLAAKAAYGWEFPGLRHGRPRRRAI